MEKGLITYDYKSQKLEDRKQKIIKIRFKTCKKCGETKLIFKFSIDKRNKDGHTRICQVCRNLEQLQYYYKNREKILIYVRKYEATHKRERSLYQKNYQEKHKESLKESAREWYIKNRKAVKKRNLKYYQDHKEICQARRKLWRIKNKENIREYNRVYKLKHKIAS